jgi:PIN domain nuclease of toxin-antitoxin system
MADVYVTDTHGLLWFLAGSTRLSEKARQVFREAQAGQATIYVPVITVAEMIWVVKAGRLQTDLNKLLATVRAHYTVIPLAIDDVIQLPMLPDNLEMHDQMIVWETMKHNATLITCDETIRAANVVKTLW